MWGIYPTGELYPTDQIPEHATLIGATGDARQAREILCACEAGDLARVNRMAMSATADTMRLALWVLACKSVRACGDEDGN